MKLLDLFLYIVDQNNLLQRKDGSFAPGVNGPYNHPETPVRNTGHWLVSNAFAFDITGKKNYKDVAYRAAQYLLSQDARPYGKTFHYRNISKRDRCSGVIGQAWTMEALWYASHVLEDHIYSDTAREVYEMHEFDPASGLWNRCEIDGASLSVDNTFNHQLWFAAIASLYGNATQSQVMRFLNNLNGNIACLDSGLILHADKDWIENLGVKERVRMAIGSIKQNPTKLSSYQHAYTVSSAKRFESSMIKKSIGYHAFNTYALGILKENLLDHPVWKGEMIRKVDAYMATEEYCAGLHNNKYGFPYNPPGFEVPYSRIALSGENVITFDEVQKWVQQQFDRQYISDLAIMGKDTNDRNTLTARIYELVRLPKEILEKVEIKV